MRTAAATPGVADRVRQSARRDWRGEGSSCCGIRFYSRWEGHVHNVGAEESEAALALCPRRGPRGRGGWRGQLEQIAAQTRVKSCDARSPRRMTRYNTPASLHCIDP